MLTINKPIPRIYHCGPVIEANKAIKIDATYPMIKPPPKLLAFFLLILPFEKDLINSTINPLGFLSDLITATIDAAAIAPFSVVPLPVLKLYKINAVPIPAINNANPLAVFILKALPIFI